MGLLPSTSPSGACLFGWVRREAPPHLRSPLTDTDYSLCAEEIKLNQAHLQFRRPSRERLAAGLSTVTCIPLEIIAEIGILNCVGTAGSEGRVPNKK